jgi:hypothetical protein
VRRRTSPLEKEEIVNLRCLVLALAFAASACGGPTLLLPGGQLEGEARPAPADWSSAGDYGTAQLETRPEDPYSVNVGFTVVDGRVYVNAGDTETRWVQHIAADPRVRLRIDGALYDLRAERVTDSGEIASFARAWTSQSRFRRDPTELEQVWLYRLVAR